MTNDIALLIKDKNKYHFEIQEHYLNKLEKNTLVFNLMYNSSSSITAKTAKAYLDILINKIPSYINKLIIADSNYFKFITKIQKISTKYGALVTGKYTGYDRFTCIYVPHFKSLFISPENKNIIDVGLNVAIKNQTNVIHASTYALTYNSDRELLDSLYKHNVLAVDIEATGLSLNSSIISISFAWNENEGSAIYFPSNGNYYTKKFFETYTGKLIFHNSLFDIKLLVRDWWMKHPTDYSGMLKGLNYFRNVHDTMLLAYLQKNSTTSISLKLKDIALEHVGNYAIDASNIINYNKEDILKYNLIDTLATFYIWNKYKIQTLSEPYTTIFRPSIYPIIKMMLVGLPMDNQRVSEVHKLLKDEEDKLQITIQNTSIIKDFNKQLQQEVCTKRNDVLKKLIKTIDEFSHIKFNPFSNIQLSTLLYTKLGFPILDKTKKGFPKTDADTLTVLKTQILDNSVLALLDDISNLIDVNKINNTFIKAFMREKDFLHGNLRLGATQSGRMSSNRPNIQNLPSKGRMGKLVKSCFSVKPGWLFAGADFSALEEKIGAILSKDPEREKIYTQGYDGHSVRAYAYFKDDMPKITKALEKTDILIDKVNIINSIAKVYPELRTRSKAPTFALQYLGTAYTLHKRAGFPIKQAIEIEQAFHSLYKESDKFNEKNKQFMEKHGYIECAFGLQLKTPIIAQCILDNSKTPYEAQAEIRSANNAVTQSWGMLLNRAVIATNNRIETAGYGEYILPINMIHDAAYFMLRDEPQYIKFLNDVLIEEMKWQNHPSIMSNKICITAEMEIGKSWANLKPLHNNATIEEIKRIKYE